MWLLYAFGSAVFASLVAVFGKIGLKNIDSTFATTIRAIIMAVFLFIVSISLGKFKDFNLSSFGQKEWIFVALSGIAGAMSWLCYFFALKYGSATVVSAVDRLSIAFVLILSITFLGESLSLYKILGVILIILGAFLTILNK